MQYAGHDCCRLPRVVPMGIARRACWVLVLAVGLSIWAGGVFAAATATERQQVLMLFSYGSGNQGFDTLLEDFRTAIGYDEVTGIEIFYEHLDLELSGDVAGHRVRLRDLLAHKYADKNIGVVVTVQEPALDFMLVDGRPIAAGAPVIALQAPLPKSVETVDRSVLGLLVPPDVEGTLKRAFEIFPDTRRVLFVAGQSAADQRMAAEAMATAAPWRDRIDFDTTGEETLEQTLHRVENLPADSIVVFLQYNRGKRGRVRLAYAVEALVTRRANAPVFGLYDFNLDNGGIGGSVVSVAELGRQAGRMALDILDGRRETAAMNAAVRAESVPMFDWTQIESWGGETGLLPSGTVFLNRPNSIWHDHAGLIAGATVVIVGQMLTIAGLIVSQRRRRAAEKAILESKTLLQAVIDSTPDWIYVRDREHRFMLVNQSFASAFGKAPENIVGRPDGDLRQPDLCGSGSAAGADHDDDAVFQGTAVHEPSERIALTNGDVRIFDTFKGPLRDAQNRIYGSLTYRRDVTERHRTEQAQQALENQLRQAQKMELIGQLTGGIAHDFNNILAAMFGYAELAQSSPAVKKNPALTHCLQEILQAGIRAKELIAQLLAFSRRKETSAETIAVAPIVKEVAALLRSTMPATISITTTVMKDLRPVKISAVQLHQVLMNLAVNARDAMNGHGVLCIRADTAVLSEQEICDSCHTAFAGRFVVFTVSDSGPGIAPEHLPNIFDPFFTTKEVGRGSGLGLPMLHGIVHTAKGHVRVSTSATTGTKFRIYLPVHDGEVAPRAGSARAAVEPVAVSGHVMVVDDDPAIIDFMTMMLEGLGCRVTGLTSAVEARRVFEDDPGSIDLVITDQTMPELTGTELARTLLSRRPDLPIILCTGFSGDIDDEAAFSLGIRRRLMKPVPARVLSDIVAEHLGAPRG